MFRFKVTMLLSCLWLLLLTASAQAVLLGRAPATPGGTDYQAYYDDVLDITWLANANLANGATDWYTAEARIGGLNAAKYLGVKTWRLPNTTQPDPTCSVQTRFGSLPLQGSDFHCTGSEMGHLYYVDGVSKFTNVQGDFYWSGTFFAASSFFNETDAWIFGFGDGSQHTRGESCNNCFAYAWPVAPGDPLFAPTNLVASQFGNNGTQIQLTWDYNANAPVDGFNVDRKAPSGSWPSSSSPTYVVPPSNCLPTSTGRSCTYIDIDNVSPFNTYTYRVRAFNTVAESDNSEEATAFQIDLLTDDNNHAMGATFRPDPAGLNQAANALGFDHFNWISYVTFSSNGLYLPDGKTYVLSPPDQRDPRCGGWYGVPADCLPYYWNEGMLPGLPPELDLKFPGSATLPANTSPNGTVLRFRDEPTVSHLDARGAVIGLPRKEFKTFLVGVKDPIGVLAQGSVGPLASFTWSSNYDAQWFNSGGILDFSRTYNQAPPDIPGPGGIFNARVVDPRELPLAVRLALIQDGVQGVSTAPKIDKDAPMTAAFPSGQQGANGWYTGPVSVTLIATDIDGPSDIAFTSYSVDGGAAIGYSAPFTVSADGIHTIQFGSVDKAGNVETPRPTQTIKVDTTPPVITAAVNPPVLWPPNGKMVNVTVSGAISDATSGVNGNGASFTVVDKYGSVQPSGNVVRGANGTYVFTIALQASRLDTDQDGRTYKITVTGQDNAGNQSATTTTVVVPHDQGH